MTERWYFKHAGKTYGPANAAQLEQLASHGKLLGTDLVWPEGASTVQAVSAQEWMKDVRSQAAPQPANLRNTGVPDWLADVARVEEEASAASLAQAAPEAAPVPSASPQPPIAAPVAAPVFVPPPAADDRCRFSVGSASTRGSVGKTNEDSLLVQHWTWGHLNTRDELALLAIAKGMGGAAEKASGLVIRSLAGVLTPTLLEVLQGAAGPVTTESLADELVRALRESNRVVHEVATARPGSKGMGATVAAVLLWESQAIISHVGDCRVYHCRGSMLSQVTRDHKLVERMVRLGQLTPEEAARHPRRNEVDQALGPRTEINPSRHALSLQPGDWLVVCSDDLAAHVDEAALEAALKQASTAPLLAHDLIDLARQGSDSCSVIAVQCY